MRQYLAVQDIEYEVYDALLCVQSNHDGWNLRGIHMDRNLFYVIGIQPVDIANALIDHRPARISHAVSLPP